MTDQPSLYLAAFAAALVPFLLLWGVSLLRRDASVVDFWWGPGFLAQCGLVAWLMPGPLGGQGALVLALIALWSVRLGLVLGRRRIGEGHEDPRYTALRASWDPGFWWKSLGIVFVLQAVLQWLMALGPLTAIVQGTDAVGTLAGIGAVAALAGLGIETLADHQLDRFRRHHPREALCDSGLRAHVRHPNYSGEMLFWAGLALVALEAGAWIAPLSPLLIGLLLVKVSGAPPIEERMALRPAYAAYRASVPAFVPRLSRFFARA